MSTNDLLNKEQLKKVEELYKDAVEQREKMEKESTSGAPAAETPTAKPETEEEKAAREGQKVQQEENIKNIINLLSSMSTNDTEDETFTKQDQLKNLFENVTDYNLLLTEVKDLLDKGFNENQIDAILYAASELGNQEFDNLLDYIDGLEKDKAEGAGKTNITQTTEGDYIIEYNGVTYQTFKDEPSLFYIEKGDGTIEPIANNNVPDVVKKDLEEYIKANPNEEINVDSEIDSLEKKNTKPEEVQPTPTETAPVSTKTEFKREDFPEVQERVDTPITQKLLDYLADTLGVPRIKVSDGKYISWIKEQTFAAQGNKGAENLAQLELVLNGPRQVFDRITKYKEAQEKTPAPVSTDAKADIEAKKAELRYSIQQLEKLDIPDQEKPGICVSITDNGPGIPPELQKKIFEPFFTTKKVGEGTGLGLHICSEIVNKHGGDIFLESRPGFTQFKVQIPLEIEFKV
jgi:hypothetical protein